MQQTDRSQSPSYFVRLGRRSFLRACFGAVSCFSHSSFGPPLAGAAETKKSGNSAVYVLLAGGLSHLDSFDPKPDAAVEVRGQFTSISTPVPGENFSEHLPRLSSSLRHISILRGLSHDISLHEMGQRFVLTGSRNAIRETPSLGAIAAHKFRNPIMPASAVIPALSPNSGILGPDCEPFNVLGDVGGLLKLGPGPDDPQGTMEFERRIALLRQLNFPFHQHLGPSAEIQRRRSVMERALSVLKSEELRLAVDLETEPVSQREQYGRTEYGDYLLLARKLIESGARLVTVVLGGWDTHIDGFTNLAQLLPQFDQAFTVLVADLADRGLLPSTLVVAASEFGRTPRVNSSAGRDHWPRAGVGLVAGGETTGGRIIGKTDGQGIAPIEGSCTPSDLAYTLLSHLGLDPATATLPPDGRKMLTAGRRLQELY